MPGNEYASAIGGGLKLKGSKPSGVAKKKKKKEKKSAGVSQEVALEKAVEGAEVVNVEKQEITDDTVSKERKDASAERDGERDDGDGEGDGYKTETQKRHEEMRRKRLEERLMKEGGLKTHKEKVEELNRYLSGLSEHHDMYVFLLFLFFIV
jgi:protein FAM32A